MQLQKGQEIKVTIEKLAFGGSGIGRYEFDGKKIVVFMENTVPGDEVIGKITRIKPKYLEASLFNIVKPSELRIEPRCKHFGLCGGCTMQNIPYEKQLEYKQSHVQETLQHIGGIQNPPMKQIIGCEDPWYYRNKMEFSFGTLTKDDTKGNLGLHPHHMKHDVFELTECFLASPDTGNLVTAVREFVWENNLKPFHPMINSGLLRCLAVRDAKRTGNRLVNLIISDEPFFKEAEFIDLLTKKAKKNNFKPADSIYLTKYIVQKGQRTEFVETHLYGEKHLVEDMQLSDGAKLSFEILPQAFFQPNSLQAEKLYDTVLKLGEITPEDYVYDLFCGTGTIGLFCAHKAKKVFGVDMNVSAIENARQNAEKNGLENIVFESGDAYDVVSYNRNEKPSLVIVDPPRVGLGAKLCEEILQIHAPRMIYVSCNPATLARDLAMLCKDVYKLTDVQPVDMFPHTAHVETVCRLTL